MTPGQWTSPSLEEAEREDELEMAAQDDPTYERDEWTVSEIR